MSADKNRNRLREIRTLQADLEVERIMKMTDSEIMADAIREYGSPEAVDRVANRMKQSVRHILEKHLAVSRIDGFGFRDCKCGARVKDNEECANLSAEEIERLQATNSVIALDSSREFARSAAKDEQITRLTRERDVLRAAIERIRNSREEYCDGATIANIANWVLDYDTVEDVATDASAQTDLIAKGVHE